MAGTSGNSSEASSQSDNFKIGELGKNFQDAFKTNFNFSDIIGQLLKMDDAASKVVKSFGVGGQNMRGIKLAMAESRDEVLKMGGTFEDIVSLQITSNEVLGRNVILQKEVQTELFATSKVTGQSNEKLLSGFKDIGVSVYNISDNMREVVRTANQMGVNANVVSGKVVDNLGKLNMYNFEGGVKGLAKMAAQATSLRIDMGETFNFAEKVFDPEGAIEVAAAMQRLGVTQSELLNPLELMNLSQNNPEKLQSVIVDMTKQFVELNDAGQFQIAPGAVRHLRKVAEATGYSYQELSKMGLGAKELERKMSRIRFNDGMTEEDRQMIANMAEMGKDGTYRLTIDDKNLSIEDAMEEFSKSPEKLKKFLDDSKPLKDDSQTIMKLRNRQLSAVESILGIMNSVENRSGTAASTTAYGDDILKSAKKFATESEKSLNKFINKNNDITYSNQAMSDLMNEQLGNMVNEFDDVVTGKKGINEVIGSLSESLDDLHDSVKEQINLFNINQGGTPNVGSSNVGSSNGTPNVNPVNDFIKLPGQIIQPLPEDTLFGGTGFESFIDKMANQKTQPLTIDPMSLMSQAKNIASNTNQNSEGSRDFKGTADVNLNIKIDAPTQIDTNQVILALENQGVKEKLAIAMRQAMSNNGMSSPKSIRDGRYNS